MMRFVSIASVAAVAAVSFSASAQAHSLHTSCIYGSMAPSGQGDPSDYHTTAEAGVHIRCTPPKGPKDPEFAPKQRGSKGNTGGPTLRY